MCLSFFVGGEEGREEKRRGEQRGEEKGSRGIDEADANLLLLLARLARQVQRAATRQRKGQINNCPRPKHKKTHHQKTDTKKTEPSYQASPSPPPHELIARRNPLPHFYKPFTPTPSESQPKKERHHHIYPVPTRSTPIVATTPSEKRSKARQGRASHVTHGRHKKKTSCTCIYKLVTSLYQESKPMNKSKKKKINYLIDG